jgi:hypothetical protein
MPDLANGETMFLIGGCSSCHAVPKQGHCHVAVGLAVSDLQP